MMRKIFTIDSHTGGEPTRTIVKGGPNLGHGTPTQKLQRLRDEYDDLRKTVVLEPRGSDVLVGAMLCEPTDSRCAAGVIFFNNVGYLQMCGHGIIGVAVTLMHLGRISIGESHLETPAGVVTVTVLDQNRVQIRNVPSWRHRKAVTINVPKFGAVTGDIAWGGNWFFLIAQHGQIVNYAQRESLTKYALAVRGALETEQITGEDGALIDHIELFATPADDTKADSRNFVLCPGGAYDRSPCGTGTSAKLACLAADHQLAEGKTWRQQSIVGSVFEASYERTACQQFAAVESFQAKFDPVIIPTITGSAWVTAETTLIVRSDDPFATGVTL